MEFDGVGLKRKNVRRVMAFAALLGLAAALPGCQIWNGWLDMLKWRGGDTAKKPKPVHEDFSGSELAASTSSALIPRVIVYRISVPVGEFSGNDKIWSQLNEDAIDSKTSVLMAQNGLRAATGSVSRWPDIAKMLDTPGARNDQILMQTDGHSSINVVTRPSVTDQIVVSVDRDLQQEGRTFERCDNGFRLSMRGVKAQVRRRRRTAGAARTSRHTRHRRRRSHWSGRRRDAERLFFRGRLRRPAWRRISSADDFLVVTAMDPKSSPFSVGTLWLSDTDKVPATETVLIFVPSGPGTGQPAHGTKTVSETKKKK